jgi:hypothetical protein
MSAFGGKADIARSNVLLKDDPRQSAAPTIHKGAGQAQGDSARSITTRAGTGGSVARSVKQLQAPTNVP